MTRLLRSRRPTTSRKWLSLTGSFHVPLCRQVLRPAATSGVPRRPARPLRFMQQSEAEPM